MVISAPCRMGVYTKLGINMDALGVPKAASLAKEERTGTAGKPRSQSSLPGL